MPNILDHGASGKLNATNAVMLQMTIKLIRAILNGVKADCEDIN